MSFELRRAFSSLEETNDVYEQLGLTKHAVLCGREEEQNQVFDLLNFDKDERTSLINVCGMTGIGKTYMVKHIALTLMTSRNSPTVLYIDASGAATVADLLVRILENPKVDRFASGEKNHLEGLFLDYLMANKQHRFVIILDDVACLMDDKYQAEELQRFFDNIINTKKKKKLWLKLLVTSQAEFHVPAKKKDVRMEEREKKDVTLGNLDTETSIKLLRLKLPSMEEEFQSKLLRYCNGHPYSLHVISELYSIGYDVSKDLDDIAASTGISDAAHQLFQKAFDRLENEQQQVLLALSLFEVDARLDALHDILGSTDSQSRKQFMETVKTDFRSRFWVSFKSITVHKVWVKPKRVTVANTYHPLVKNFLRGIVDKQLSDTSCPHYEERTKMKKRYIINQMGRLVDVGQTCLQSPQLACQQFMHGKANFRTALKDILSMQTPELLFATLNADDSYELLRLDDILHLCLTLHEYHDCFDGQLLTTLVGLDQHMGSGCEANRMLIYTMYVITLNRNRDWSALDKVLQRQSEYELEDVDDLNPNIPIFCRALLGYARSMLFTLSPIYKRRKEPQFIKERQEIIDDALQCFDSLPRILRKPTKYFIIKILLHIKAECIYSESTNDIETLQTALGVCRKALSYTDDVLILKPSALLEVSEYLTLVGHQYVHQNHDYVGAVKLYKEAGEYNDKTIKEYQRWNMETCSTSAKAMLSYSLLTKAQACAVTEFEQKDISDKERDEAIKYYKQSCEHAGKAAVTYTIINSSSKLHLTKCLQLQAGRAQDILRLIKAGDPKELRERDLRYYHSVELQSYIKAYNYILTDPRHCDMTPRTQTFVTVRNELPKVLEQHGYEQKAIKSVVKQLKNIEHNQGNDKKVEVDVNATLIERDVEFVLEEEEKQLIRSARGMRIVNANVGGVQTTSNKEEASRSSKKRKNLNRE